MGICFHLEIGSKNQKFLEHLKSAAGVMWTSICICVVSSLKWTTKMSTLPTLEKFCECPCLCFLFQPLS